MGPSSWGYLKTNNDNRFSLIVKEMCGNANDMSPHPTRKTMLIKFNPDNEGLQITKTIAQMIKRDDPLECPILDVSLIDISDPENTYKITDTEPSDEEPVVLVKNPLDVEGSRFIFNKDKPRNLKKENKKYKMTLSTGVQEIDVDLTLTICGYETIRSNSLAIKDINGNTLKDMFGNIMYHPVNWVYQKSATDIIIPRLSFESSFYLDDADCKIVDFFLLEDREDHEARGSGERQIVSNTHGMRKINHVNLEF